MECKICQRQFTQESDLRNHLEIHHDLFKCEYCEYLTKRKQDLKRHKLAKHSNFVKCQHCNCKFSSKEHLTDHENSEHQLLSCQFCNFTTKNKNNLPTHILMKHKAQSNQDRKRSNTNTNNQESAKKFKVDDSQENSSENDRNQNLVQDEPVPGPSNVPNPSSVPQSDQLYKCNLCNYLSKRKQDVKRHKMGKHSNFIKCNHCNKKFPSSENLAEHENIEHQLLRCNQCSFVTRNRINLSRHILIKHTKQSPDNNGNNSKHQIPAQHDQVKAPSNAPIPPPVQPEPVSGPSNVPDPPPIPLPPPLPPPPNQVTGRFRNLIHRFSFKPRGKSDLKTLFNTYKKRMASHLLHLKKIHDFLKYYIVYAIQFYKEVNGNRIEMTWYFYGGMRYYLERNSFDQTYEESINQIEKKVDEFVHMGSGWIFDYCKQIDLHVFKYSPPRGGSYVKTPPWIQKKKAVVNIKNEDDFCFIYSILAALMYESGRTTYNLEYISHYKDHLDELEFSGLPMPMSLDDIPTFERNNHLSINVYCLNEKKNRVVPLRISKVQKIKPINLLLLEEENKLHYTWIKNFNRLLSSKKFTRFFCPFCLWAFSKEKTLEKHQDRCRMKYPARVTCPKKKIRFSQEKNMLMSPFCIYADFECLLKEKHEQKGERTEIKAEHVPCGFSFVTTSPYSQFQRKEVRYRGKDCAKKFVEEIVKERNRLLKIIDEESKKPMKALTQEEEIAHDKADKCWVSNNTVCFFSFNEFSLLDLW